MEITGTLVLQILGMGVTSAVVGSLLTWGISSFTKAREQTAKARYSAIRLIAQLDAFAFACADEISRTQMEVARYNNPYADELSFSCNVPTLDFPDSISWESLDLDLAQRGLVFENDRQKALAYISSSNMTSGPPYESADEEIEQVAVLGYRAHQLAQDLKKRYPECNNVEEIYPWDHIKTLKRYHDKTIADFAERRKWNAENSQDTAS